MSQIGSFGFSYLPVMFVIAVPLGMVHADKGVAAFAGFVSFVIMNLAVNFVLKTEGVLSAAGTAVAGNKSVVSILGIQSIDTGILGGIIVGLIVLQAA